MHAWSTSMLIYAAFHIYAQHVKMPLKREVGCHALYSHVNYIVDHEKSWNCVFEFLDDIFCLHISDMHRTSPFVISGSVDQTVKVWECR